MIHVGMDFGTSNSSIALYDHEGGGIRLFPVDPDNINPNLLRSFIYMTRDYEHYTGSEAVRQYLEHETGRPVYWETKPVGTIQNVWSGVPSTGGEPIFVERDVVAEVDVAAHGRLIQSIKTALRRPGPLIRGRSDSPRIQVFERLYPVEDLIALLMGRMRESAEQALGQPVDGVVIGRPVRISEDPVIDARGEDILRDAARFAGFKEIAFELEPVAAAHAYHRIAADRQTALVFDFGGGTLDLTVVEVGGQAAPKVLASHGILLGGDDLDRALIRLLRPHLGEGATLRDGTPLPAHILEQLNSWQAMVELSRPRYREVMRQAMLGSDPEAISRLEALVRHNLGFKLFQELEQGKIRLSSTDRIDIALSLNGAELRERITRTQFERLIQDELAQVDESLDEVLRLAGLEAGGIDVVVRTGGSAEVPAFIRLLERKFGEDRLRPLNPFETIVGGLAFQAAG
ncbi:MAG TPA: Hsp70 family protein [Anaerolineales bacterium]|nr:Hsp70 family protein [Anaerolineales bacterium]